MTSKITSNKYVCIKADQSQLNKLIEVSLEPNNTYLIDYDMCKLMSITINKTGYVL